MKDKQVGKIEQLTTGPGKLETEGKHSLLPDNGLINKPMEATKPETLEQHILNSNYPKTEAEWWAHHEIQRLQDKLKYQCTECPLNRRYNDSEHPAFLRRQAD